MELQPATREKLGAVIVGDGFKITEKGVLNVDENFKFVEFTRAKLEKLFAESKLRRR